ncbi:diaminopimelate decarboxylase family protein [Anaerocolumna sp. MB42-C2]|uniref:diaminopimelate decarboxylase family protein n=1 Tax=Anaerocolumna sp. MB42-C2 TaxID=3070997 RepID=UPI0027DFFFB8|nr:alanine racemase [Anaerocolumna sp. MB42-C2]WMJ86930.1 alanine racemase [Anaerocolumna sp. MB42-C2]
MNESILKQAISQYKTPFYIFNTDLLAVQINKLRTALGPDVELCYAMKANPFIIKELQDLVDFYEVCSPGEFRICERAQINMNQVVMSGVYKNQSDIEYALNQYGNQIIYTIESLTHWQLIENYALKQQITIRVLLRLTSGNQFGMDESLIRQIIENRHQNFISIDGIQFFSGTQKKSIHKYENELNMLDQFCCDLKKQYDFTVKKLEYGPGLPVYYFEDETDEEELILGGLSQLIKKLTFGGKIALELGRSIAAPCGAYVTSIVDTKINKNQPYCIVDGGIHQVNYYGQMLAMKKPPLIHWNKRSGETREWTVCGSLCTINDVLVKQYPFTSLQTGDTLIFEKTGAYSVTEGISLFLSRELPQVLLYSEQNQFRIARNMILTDHLNYFHS